MPFKRRKYNPFKIVTSDDIVYQADLLVQYEDVTGSEVSNDVSSSRNSNDGLSSLVCHLVVSSSNTSSISAST